MLVFLTACLLFFTPSASPREPDIRWVYVSSGLVWEAPPKDPELPKYEYTYASLAVFYPSGEFREGSFALGRYGERGVMFIIMGEGFAIVRGKWTRNSDGSITVESRVVYEDKVLIIPEGPIPGPLTKERWELHGSRPGRLAAVLRSPHQEYVPLRSLSDLKRLGELLEISPKSKETGAEETGAGTGCSPEGVARRLGSEDVRASQRSSAALGRTANAASPSPGPRIIIAPLSPLWTRPAFTG
jgi:hypothetical protein